MGWKDAVFPNVWNGEESAAEEWFEKVMDYARRRMPGLAEWLKANEHGEDVIMLADVGLDHAPFDTEKRRTTTRPPKTDHVRKGATDGGKCGRQEWL